jgi:hypothetical protein
MPNITFSVPFQNISDVIDHASCIIENTSLKFKMFQDPDLDKMIFIESVVQNNTLSNYFKLSYGINKSGGKFELPIAVDLERLQTISQLAKFSKTEELLCTIANGSVIINEIELGYDNKAESNSKLTIYTSGVKL